MAIRKENSPHQWSHIVNSIKGSIRNFFSHRSFEYPKEDSPSLETIYKWREDATHVFEFMPYDPLLSRPRQIELALDAIVSGSRNVQFPTLESMVATYQINGDSLPEGESQRRIFELFTAYRLLSFIERDVIPRERLEQYHKDVDRYIRSVYKHLSGRLPNLVAMTDLPGQSAINEQTGELLFPDERAFYTGKDRMPELMVWRMVLDSVLHCQDDFEQMDYITLLRQKVGSCLASTHPDLASLKPIANGIAFLVTEKRACMLVDANLNAEVDTITHYAYISEGEQAYHVIGVVSADDSLIPGSLIPETNILILDSETFRRFSDIRYSLHNIFMYYPKCRHILDTLWDEEGNRYHRLNQDKRLSRQDAEQFQAIVEESLTQHIDKVKEIIRALMQNPREREAIMRQSRRAFWEENDIRVPITIESVNYEIAARSVIHILAPILLDVIYTHQRFNPHPEEMVFINPREWLVRTGPGNIMLDQLRNNQLGIHVLSPAGPEPLSPQRALAMQLDHFCNTYYGPHKKPPSTWEELLQIIEQSTIDFNHGIGKAEVIALIHDFIRQKIPMPYTHYAFLPLVLKYFATIDRIHETEGNGHEPIT
ncbi:hypothetical protein HY408_01080 [Candidatus Gottesmanbacteria bacterium]|nr:hypothetical protein [Candidatus Gottesmanbacteria bacterium]